MTFGRPHCILVEARHEYVATGTPCSAPPTVEIPAGFLCYRHVQLRPATSHCRDEPGAIEGISDHRMLMCILPLDCPIPMQTVAQTIINFEEANDAPIQTYLAHEFSAFSELASDPLSDVNDVWLRFKAIVSHCVTNFIPVKLKKPLKNNPWITREVIHAKRQLKRIRKANKAAGTNPSNASRLALAAKHFK